MRLLAHEGGFARSGGVRHKFGDRALHQCLRAARIAVVKNERQQSEDYAPGHDAIGDCFEYVAVWDLRLTIMGHLIYVENSNHAREERSDAARYMARKESGFAEGRPAAGVSDHGAASTGFLLKTRRGLSCERRGAILYSACGLHCSSRGNALVAEPVTAWSIADIWTPSGATSGKARRRAWNFWRPHGQLVADGVNFYLGRRCAFT